MDGWCSRVVALVLGVAWYPLKSTYFHFVAGRCGEASGLRAIPWEPGLAFDAEVHRFVATGDAEESAMACIVSWAGFLIEHVDTPAALRQTDKRVLETIAISSHTGGPIPPYYIEFDPGTF